MPGRDNTPERRTKTQMKTAFKTLFVMTFLLTAVAGAQAAPYYFNDDWVEVDYWAGTGANEAIIVIDWNNTNGPYDTESHAWGFKWDGTKKIVDALTALDSAGALNIATGYGGAFLNDAYYNEATQGIGTDNHTSAGYTGWWAIAECFDGINWALSGGIGGNLTNDKYFGHNVDSGAWTVATLDTPFTSAPVPVPAAFWLLGSGIIGLVGLRRRSNQ
jgi:hypothetical protein